MCHKYQLCSSTEFWSYGKEVFRNSDWCHSSYTYRISTVTGFIGEGRSKPQHTLSDLFTENTPITHCVVGKKKKEKKLLRHFF